MLVFHDTEFVIICTGPGAPRAGKEASQVKALKQLLPKGLWLHGTSGSLSPESVCWLVLGLRKVFENNAEDVASRSPGEAITGKFSMGWGLAFKLLAYHNH